MYTPTRNPILSQCQNVNRQICKIIIMGAWEHTFTDSLEQGNGSALWTAIERAMCSRRSQPKGHSICNARTFHCRKPMYLPLHLDVMEEKLRQESGEKTTGARGGERASYRSSSCNVKSNDMHVNVKSHIRNVSCHTIWCYSDSEWVLWSGNISEITFSMLYAITTPRRSSRQWLAIEVQKCCSHFQRH